MEGIARLILEKSGLSKYFDVSSFDDGLSTRAQIVQRAIERAKSMKYDFGKIIVIGDTAYDIEAAKIRRICCWSRNRKLHFAGASKQQI